MPTAARQPCAIAGCPGLQPCARHSTALATVELITGPPGAGKSTLVAKRMERGEALLDFDQLYAALSGLALHDRIKPDPGIARAAWSARETACVALMRAVPRIWVITCAPTRDQRRHSVDVFRGLATSCTVLETPAAVCLDRIEQSGRVRADWRGAVEDWWRGYRRPDPHEGWARVDVVVNG